MRPLLEWLEQNVEEAGFAWPQGLLLFAYFIGCAAVLCWAILQSP